MLALHVSDTHLGAMPFGLFSRAKDIYAAFAETVEIAIRERVTFYIHAGDFFDSPNPPPEAYVVAYRGLKKLKEKGIKVIVISGQHDTPKKLAVSPLQLLLDLGVIDILAVNEIAQREVEIEGRKINFVCVPYTERDRIPNIGKTVKDAYRNVLVAHLLLRELGIPSDQADISLSRIPQWFNYVALGDYHIKSEFRHGLGYAVYPGATEVLRVNECCDKYVAMIDLSLESPKPQYIKLMSVRPWIILDYKDFQHFMEELTKVITELKRQGAKPPIVVVNAQNEAVKHVEKLLISLRERGEIEYFRIRYREDRDEEIKQTTPFEELEHIDVLKLIEQVVNNPKLAQLLLNLIKEPSKSNVKSIIEYLKEDMETAKRLEAIGRAGKIPINTKVGMQGKIHE
jgi:DNA repair exonuclease SbcCD nuclease subunit